MTIDPEKIRWASVASTFPISGDPNRSAPSSEFKNTGVVENQPLPLQWLNNQFYEQYNALVDLQQQITDLTVGVLDPLIGQLFPVGTLWYTDNASIDPAVQFGVGTWVKVATGRFIVGVDTGNTDFDVAGKTGGSDTHGHTAGTLGADGHVLTIDEMPSHGHSFSLYDRGINAALEGTASTSEITGDSTSYTTQSAGSNQPHTHTVSGNVADTKTLQPYYATIIWKRTA